MDVPQLYKFSDPKYKMTLSRWSILALLVLNACRMTDSGPGSPWAAQDGEVTSEFAAAEQTSLPPPLTRLDMREPSAAEITNPVIRGLWARRQELNTWVYALVTSYLPRGASLPKEIHIVSRDTVLRPSDALTLQVSVANFHSTEDLTFGQMVQSIFLAALANWVHSEAPQLEGALTKAKEMQVNSHTDLEAALLATIWREGLAAYVAGHGQPFDHDGVDLLLWQKRSTLTPCFMELRAALRETSNPQKTWQDLLSLDRSKALFSVVGAHMASRIERDSSRTALVAATARGPHGFYAAYMALEPGALVSFELKEPTVPPEGQPSLPSLTH